MEDKSITIRNLSKVYAGTKKSPAKKALDDVSIDIPKGSIFGLLGPNGAGKSTLINIMAGLVVKTSGEVIVWDSNIDENMRQAKASIGIVPQEINYDPFFTPAKLLDIQAGLYGVPTKERRTMELLKLVGLEDKADAYTRSLSGGMRRRLMVAKAMVHNPPILVLDEPTAGVDVQLRQDLWRNVKELNRNGVTILLTTHYLEEAEEMCDQIAIINHGKIIANESKEKILARIDTKEIKFRLDRELVGIPKRLQKYNVEQEGKRTLTIRYSPEEHFIGEFIEILRKDGYEIADISTDDSNLEDVFLQMTNSNAA